MLQPGSVHKHLQHSSARLLHSTAQHRILPLQYALLPRCLHFQIRVVLVNRCDEAGRRTPADMSSLHTCGLLSLLLLALAMPGQSMMAARAPGMSTMPVPYTNFTS